MDLQDGQAQHAIGPVCGMEVNPATAAGSSEHEGTTYYFCSVGCKRQFDKDPQVFVEPPQHLPGGTAVVRAGKRDAR